MPLDNYPLELFINERLKLHTSQFYPEEKLYHAFDNEDLDNEGRIKLETIRFPDFSCNWSRFSKPEYIRFRKNGSMTDGCYSFSVNTSRYKNLANVVHDPSDDNVYPNYAHVEVRRLLEGESIDIEPPKGRIWKTAKSLRLEYRQNILNNQMIELEVK